jgi:hypothetical protein
MNLKACTVNSFTLGIKQRINSRCGQSVVLFILWSECCFVHTVVRVLCCSHCGQSVALFTLWSECCVVHTVVRVLFCSHCGQSVTLSTPTKVIRTAALACRKMKAELSLAQQR